MKKITLVDAVDPKTGDAKSITMTIEEDRELDDLMRKFSATRAVVRTEAT